MSVKADCVFCKIVKGELSADIISDTKNILAFKDKDPSADTHILIIPKIHIETFMEIKNKHMSIINQIMKLAQNLVMDKKIGSNYKIVVNGGGYQYVPHVHWHLLGGELTKHP